MRRRMSETVWDWPPPIPLVREKVDHTQAEQYSTEDYRQDAVTINQVIDRVH